MSDFPPQVYSGVSVKNTLNAMLELAQTEALVNTADIEDLVDPGFCR